MSDAEPPVPRRSEAKRAQDRRRRERMRANGRVERYDVAEIGARDGWVCGLCGDPVDQARRRPDPRSPSIDHIRTVAAGGTDSRDNVRLTHWGCNHERNVHTPLRTVEEAEAQRAALRRIPSLREYAESLDPEEMVRRSQAAHSPERYRARLARRVERHEQDGR
ncbi:HNH endonuclease [Streptomyces sp. NPDC057438]|uniref:HNH endonuclease n=1 Tax=Streptomyces sp. NPDC057438 TaxID=3346133 RepID=UPI0036847AE5